MSQSVQNPFLMWMEANKGMIDAWSAWASQMTPQSEGHSEKASENPWSMNAYYDLFTKNFMQNPMFSFMGSGANTNMLEQFYKQWQDNLRTMSPYIPNKAVRDGFDRFLDSYQLFSGLQGYWDMVTKNMPKDFKDWDAFAKPTMKYYQDLMGTFTQAFMPDQLKSFFVSPFENTAAVQSLLSDFFKPWLEGSATAQGYLVKAMTGDREAYRQFLEVWKEMYENSSSKFLNMPAVGSHRVTIEKMMKLLDYYMDFITKFNEYTLVISNMLSDTMEKLLAHLSELSAEGKQPKTFMEFYKVWSTFNERAFETLFATDEFARIMNEAISAGSKFKILFEDLWQDLLTHLPVPNNKDFDSICKEIFDLRKQVKAQGKELKAIREQMAAGSKS